jgi:hypothetical protein
MRPSPGWISTDWHDFLEREGSTKDDLGEAFASVGVMGWDRALAAVHIEAGVLPGKEVGELTGADEFAFAQGVEEPASEEFGHLGVAFGGHAVEAAVGG